MHRDLGVSAGAAHYRKTAAELMQRFPEIVEPLRDGRLCITTMVQLAKVLTPENCPDVLPRFFQRSKREAMALAAELRPATATPQREVVTALLPAAPPLLLSRPAVQPVEICERPSIPEGAVQPVEVVGPARPVVMPARRDSAEPLTGELSRLHVTVSRRFLQKLEAARDALSHARPGASTEAILEAGLDLVLKQRAKRKGLVDNPRSRAPAAKPDALTAKVRREVWTRDGGRCQWPLDSGGICGSTLRVEFDHSVIPRARGGPSSAKNLRLLCRVHNDLAAQAFGDHWMDQFTRRCGGPAAVRLAQGLPSG